MKTSLTAIALAITTLTACQPGDSNILAQVGEEKLTVNDVLLKMPLTCTGADSVLFVERNVNSWVNEQLLYQQGLRSVPDLDQIEREVAQYRRDLIVRMYQHGHLRRGGDGGRMCGVLREKQVAVPRP